MTRRTQASWFRRLLVVLPRRFRERHGEPMEQVFRSQLEEAEGPGDTARLWLATVAGLLRTAPGEHLRVLIHDTKVALRGMRRSLVPSGVVIATLALGIGANATLFSVVNQMLLRPLPFADDERLVRLYVTRDGQPPYLSPGNPALLEALMEHAESFDGIAPQRFADVTVSTPEGPERLPAMYVGADWLSLLGLELHAGRGFTAQEEELGLDADVALVSHGFWRRALGARSDAVGSAEITVEGRRRTIVGVLPEGFHYPYRNELWLPMNLRREGDGFWGYNLPARIRAGRTHQEVEAELEVLSRRIDSEYGGILRGMTFTALPIRDVLLDDESGFVLFLLGAVTIVLLLISLNVGNLVLARAIAREGEMAIRAALGASRFRQVRQLMTESLTLAALGGAGGLGIAYGCRGVAAALVPERFGRLVSEIELDYRVLGFTLALSIVVGVLFGALPALRASGFSLRSAMPTGARGAPEPKGRVSVGLVVGEIALALVVLASAATLALHYRTLDRIDLGYPAEDIVVATVPLDDERYDEGPERTRFVRAARERLESLPGVTHAAAINLFPSPRGNFLAEIAVEGQPVDPEAPMTLNYRLASPELFDTLGIRLLRGRGFRSEDDGGSPRVAVISERAARRYFRGQDPLGQRLRSLRADEEDAWATIVGVVSDVREFHDVEETFYLPYAQHASHRAAAQAVFVLRSGSAGSGLGAVASAVHEVDARLPVFHLETARDVYRESLGGERLTAILGALFASFGLVMAALGVFGVMAYSVAQRTREIGLRMALGARPGDVWRRLVRRGATWTAGGVAAGTLAHVAVSGALARMFPDVEPLGTAPFLGIAALLASVAVAACAVPALRAVRVDPLRALRSE